MHVQILEINRRLTARYVANAPHLGAMLIKAADGRNRSSGRNVKRPAIRAWGQYHSRVIGSMGGECELLRKALRQLALDHEKNSFGLSAVNVGGTRRWVCSRVKHRRKIRTWQQMLPKSLEGRCNSNSLS